MRRTLRIAFCPPELQPLQLAVRGEPTNATYLIQGHIAKSLVGRGHHLTYIAGSGLGDNTCTTDLADALPAPLTWSRSVPFRLLERLTWRVQRLLGIPYLNIFSNLRLCDACLQCLPGHDVVYERNGLYRNGVAMACRRLNLPHVLFVEADEILEHDYMGSPITGLLRWSAGRQFHYNLRATDRVICVSEPLKRHLVERWHVPVEKIVVFHNAVEVEQFQPDLAAREDIRARLGISDRPMILFVGNFYEWHDVGILLEAFEQVLAHRPDARLVLVGDGVMRDAMEQRAATLGTRDAVRFVGLIPHANVPRYMAAADVAVVPYKRMELENWLSPLKLFEYMAAGRAVVASAVGQVTQAIEHERNGLLVPAGDAGAMTRALIRLIQDENLRARLGQQARDDAVRHYSWDTYVSNLEAVLLDVTTRKAS